MHFFLRVSTFNRPFSSVSLSFHPAWLQACNPRSRVENKSYDSEKRNVSRNIAFLCFTFVGLQTEVECGVCCRGHGHKPGLRGDGKRAWRRALCRQLCRWRPAGGRERGEGKRRSESSACPHTSVECIYVLHECIGTQVQPLELDAWPLAVAMFQDRFAPPSAALHHVCMWRQTAGLCGRGRGLIASRDIVRGEPVFCEDVFVYAPRGDKFSQVLYVPTCLRHSVSHFENLCQEKVLTMGLATARDLQIWRCSCTHPPLSLTLTCRYKGVREQTLLSCTLGPVW